MGKERRGRERERERSRPTTVSGEVRRVRSGLGAAQI
jgi:hypothetical protein